jgi:molecular chaperone DnaK (HSP70)
VRFEKTSDGLRSHALARSGVGVAGDAFDYRIIDQLVSPELGKGGLYRAFDKSLPIPQRYYAAFARWDQLALLRASRDMRDIRALARTAVEPEKIARLIEVLDDNHGYALYQAVSRLKMGLSQDDEATFSFIAGSVAIERTVARHTFEGWIAPELAAIEAAVDQAMQQAGPGGLGRRPRLPDRRHVLRPGRPRHLPRRFGPGASRPAASSNPSPRVWRSSAAKSTSICGRKSGRHPSRCASLRSRPWTACRTSAGSTAAASRAPDRTGWP